MDLLIRALAARVQLLPRTRSWPLVTGRSRAGLSHPSSRQVTVHVTHQLIKVTQLTQHTHVTQVTQLSQVPQVTEVN